MRGSATPSRYDRGFDFSTGRNPYATQSTLWFASSCIVGVVAFFVYPRECSPQIVLATLQLLFFLMSALNHAYETVSHGNWLWQNMNRVLLSLAMVAGAVSRQGSKTQASTHGLSPYVVHRTAVCCNMPNKPRHKPGWLLAP